MGMTREEYLTRAVELAARGKSLPQSRLDEDKVIWIRENKEKLSAKAQSERLGVHHRTVEKVRHYETWAHVRSKS